MKKYFTLILVIFLFTSTAFAQFDGILNSAQNFVDTTKKVFPLILVGSFIVGFLFNQKLFFGEDADMKKGLSRVLVWVGAAAVATGIITWLGTLTL